MDLLPKSKSEFSQSDYWNTFFKQRGNKAFEWYGEYPALSGFIHKYIRPKDQILVVGCGNSKLSADLYDIGFKNMTNIDVSKVVIKQMKAINASRPELKFDEMDALNMSYNDSQFSVVLDKGTLDALMPDDKIETKQQIDKYFNEIDRVLRLAGRYVCISLLQDHLLTYLLESFSKKGWMIRIHRCKEAEEMSREQGATLVLPVFFVVITKFKNNSQLVVEIGFSSDGSVNKVNSLDKVTSMIKELQEVAMVCGGLKKAHSPGQELTIDVFQPNTSDIKYRVFIVDNKSSLKPLKFAAFVIPHGRENDYIYCCSNGRQVLLEYLSMDRLAIIQIADPSQTISLDKVQEELTPLISDVAPIDCKKPIGFLTSSSEDDDNRTVISKGTSDLSGDYMIYDIELDGQTIRKLIFLSNSNVTQSEARLKKVRGRKGKKLVVDVGYLSCYHHLLMSIGTCTVLDQDSTADILVIGLGGGSLCGYLHKCFANSTVFGIDIDEAMVKISTEYFNLTQDNRMKLIVDDGLKYIHQCLCDGKKYDVIMFDVDNKDSSLGMSCPPKEFIKPEVLNTILSLLTNNGIFILNLVCRNTKLKREVYTRIKKVFKSPCCLKVPDELGEVLLCWKSKPSQPNQIISQAIDKLSVIIDKNKFQKISDVENITQLIKQL